MEPGRHAHAAAGFSGRLSISMSLMELGYAVPKHF